MPTTLVELCEQLEQKLAVIRRDDARARRREVLGREITDLIDARHPEEDIQWAE